MKRLFEKIIGTGKRSSSRRWRRERIQRDIPLRPQGNVEFYALEGDDLDNVATVAQALDNQWVSRSLLKKMLAHNSSNSSLQGLADIQTARNPVVRAEYMRALITSQQVVVNRAYMYNTPTINQDYLQLGESRESLKALLGSGVIVPWLYTEHRPDEAPAFGTTEAFDEWQRLCQEVRMHCVRLSWDDQENTKRGRAMAARFSAWLGTMDIVEDLGDFGAFMRDVGVAQSSREAFLRQLKAVSRWRVEQDVVTREKFYKKFIVADDSEPVDGRYDPGKDFSGEIKQLADLSYATNLPDALGRYALTPIDALPRTTLQELRVIYGEAGNIITAKDLKTLLQREAFSRITGLQGGAFLKSLASLTLSEVSEIRNSNEWIAYMEDLDALLANPLEFERRLKDVSERYVGLARVIAGFIKDDKRRNLERWMPAITLVINVGSAVITALWDPSGNDFTNKVIYGTAGNVAQDAAGVVCRLIIGGIADRQAQAQLETSIDFMRARVTDARAVWKDLTETLGLEKGTVRADEFAERLIIRSQDMYDPNVNYASDEVQIVGAVG